MNRPAAGASRPNRHAAAFTIIELLVVIAIIVVLAALVLGTVGYVQKKAGRSRTEAEIMALSAAIESYKADNGIYPRDTTNQYTDKLDARTSFSPTNYWTASQFLYGELTGDRDFGGANAGEKSYINFKFTALGRADMTTAPSAGNPVLYLRDPFGNSYGYSTAYQKDLETTPGTVPTHGYNPTFDLWSTASDTSGTQAQWVKNW